MDNHQIQVVGKYDAKKKDRALEISPSVLIMPMFDQSHDGMSRC